MKICNKCNKQKALTEFYYRKDNDTYRTECKECTKAAKTIRENQPGVKEKRARKEKLRRIKHKNRINQTLYKQRYGTPELKANSKKKAKLWRSSKGGILSYYKSLLQKRNKYANDKVKQPELHTKKRIAERRRRYKTVYPNVLVSSLKDYYNRFLYTPKICSYCGTSCETSWTLDHINPSIRGGNNTVDNLTITCVYCNSSKGATPLLIWLIQQKITNKYFKDNHLIEK